jgi:hypothetical protein
MEAIEKQLCIDYQRPSLIEFLLGGHGISGWLDAYSVRNSSRTPDVLQHPVHENHAAAA